jgi:hypothetical protein|tara:strand:+ start:8320 stop:8580 length:261 start_codon:yes stop_codon:yes gene_type:complete
MFSTYPVITLVTVLAIVLVVAYHLIGIFYNLKKTGDNLSLLAIELKKTNENTNPLSVNIEKLNEGLTVLLKEFTDTLKNITPLSSR